MKLSLSKRLKKLYDWSVIADRKSIYDLCCDHGHLAYTLWRDKKDTEVYAVDIAVKVVAKLRQTLGPLTDERFHIIEQAGENISFKDDSVIIIAGVGAHTTMNIVDAIKASELQKFDLMICCHQNIEVLRDYLQNLDGLGLNKEVLIKEHSQFYEILWLRSNGSKIGEVAQSFWGESPDAKEYYHRQIKHWGRTRTAQGSRILKLYEEVGKRWEF